MAGSAPPDTEEVWRFDEHPGFRRAIEGASTVAAPLLAGFAFTLLVLILPTLASERTPRLGAGGLGTVEGAQPFSRYPELAALLLLLAGLLMVMSVQAALTARYHSHRPSELEEWYPQHFRTDADFDPADTPEWMRWSTEEWPAGRVGDRWYSGWAREFFFSETKSAQRWANWARRFYHVGIVALLTGVAVVVLPPPGDVDGWRLAIAAVAVAGVVVEVAWIAYFTELGGKLAALTTASARGAAERAVPRLKRARASWTKWPASRIRTIRGRGNRRP